MKPRFIFLFTIIAVFLYSCSTPKYFHDKSSFERQKELKTSRSQNITSEIAMGIYSIFASAALDLNVEYYPSEQEFKKLNLINPTTDTMYINMLTDIYWDENNYCDFMDIRIPPKTECKVLVPVNANYNLYFSSTPQDDDDEMLKIFTSDLKRVSLYPGITNTKDSVIIVQ